MLLASGASFAQSADQPGHKRPKPGTNTEAVSKVEDATAGMVGTISAHRTGTTEGFVTATATRREVLPIIGGYG
jgi:3-oxoacyl-(acyl-carrier-protein) synthase